MQPHSEQNLGSVGEPEASDFKGKSDEQTGQVNVRSMVFREQIYAAPSQKLIGFLFELGILTGWQRWEGLAGIGEVFLRVAAQLWEQNLAPGSGKELFDCPGLFQSFALHGQVEVAVMLDRIPVSVEQCGVPVAQGLVPLGAMERESDVTTRQIES